MSQNSEISLELRNALLTIAKTDLDEEKKFINHYRRIEIEQFVEVFIFVLDMWKKKEIHGLLNPDQLASHFEGIFPTFGIFLRIIIKYSPDELENFENLVSDVLDNLDLNKKIQTSNVSLISGFSSYF